MNKTVKLFSLIAVLAFSLSASAQDIKIGGIGYKIVSLEDLTCELDNVERESVDFEVVVPSTITYKGRTLKVVGIADGAFSNIQDINRKILCSVKIGSNVKRIGWHAFRWCSYLETLRIPNTVEVLNVTALQESGIKNLIIEDGNTPLEIEIPNIGNIYDWFIDDVRLETLYLGRPLSDPHVIAKQKDLKVLTIGKSVPSLPIEPHRMLNEKLEIINLMNPDPIFAASQNFTNYHYLNTKICVPEGSLDAYKKDESWQKFWTIEEGLQIPDIREPEKPVKEEPKKEVEIAVQPQFPGGEAALNGYYKKKMKYPKIAQENGVQGKVIVDFIVTETGELTDIEILRGVDSHLDNEALRLVREMPNWIPAKTADGEPARVKFSLPINFRIG